MHDGNFFPDSGARSMSREFEICEIWSHARLAGSDEVNRSE